jgi:hypothetical protein
MSEFATWALPVFAALALYALSYGTLQASPRGRDYLIAALWFSFGSAVFLTRFLYWAFTTTRSSMFRTVASLLVCGAIVAVTIETVRSIYHKRKDWIASQSITVARPEFRVLDKSAFPHLVELDANIFKVNDKKQSDMFFPIVIGFQNIPDESGFNEIDTVWAQIIYREPELENGAELARANVGCWINEPVADVSFPLDRPRFLLLGGWYIKHSKMPAEDTFIAFQYSRELHRPVQVVEKMATPRKLFVDVVLAVSGHPKSKCEYRFDVRLGKVGPRGAILYQRDLIEKT